LRQQSGHSEGAHGEQEGSAFLLKHFHCGTSTR
jgi:hypothetical protein